MKLSRRNLIHASLASLGAVGLRSLVTGLPKSFLTTGSIAQAAEGSPKFLIMDVGGQGDPLNANCPGSYVKGVYNNPSPLLAPQDFSLGSTKTRAAAPWTALPEALRARMSFIHHSTDTNAHPEYEDVMFVHGAVKPVGGVGREMLSSAISQETHKTLDTIQAEPINMAGSSVTLQGTPLDNVRPDELQAVFEIPDDLGLKMQKLRDESLDQIYGDMKKNGTASQRRFLDRYALAASQARELGNQLTPLLSDIGGDLSNDEEQAVAAAALVKLRVAPVINVHFGFGGDNHNDGNLELEAESHLQAIPAMGRLWQELVGYGIEDEVTFGYLNVFGRTLVDNGRGRNHNQDHHVMCLFGPDVKGSVIGGIAPTKKDFGAQSFDSSTGQVDPQGDIQVKDSLASAARTLATACGLSQEAVESRIAHGKVIDAALR